MKILVTGGTGQIGHALIETVPEGIEMVTPDSHQLNLAMPLLLGTQLTKIKPDAIINAAAYTAVDKAEQEPELARLVNVDAVRTIADYCNQQHIPLIHISTDFVFNGQQNNPYSPDHPADPISVYGRTKYAGEEAARSVYPAAYIIRSSWVYGVHGHNFVKTMLRLAKANQPIRVVSTQTGSPTYVINLALVIWQILTVLPEDKLLHYSDGKQTSWYEFALAIFTEAKATGLLQTNPNIQPISSSEWGALAPRPAYSVLDSSRTLKILDIPETNWRDSLHDMVARLSRS